MSPCTASRPAFPRRSPASQSRAPFIQSTVLKVRAFDCLRASVSITQRHSASLLSVFLSLAWLRLVIHPSRSESGSCRVAGVASQQAATGRAALTQPSNPDRQPAGPEPDSCLIHGPTATRRETCQPVCWSARRLPPPAASGQRGGRSSKLRALRTSPNPWTPSPPRPLIRFRVSATVRGRGGRGLKWIPGGQRATLHLLH